MNHDPRLSASEELEWSAQERALGEERAGLAPGQGDSSLHAYRYMARLLAQPPDEQLPPDFARQVARRAQQAASPVDTRLERRLLAALVAAMGLAGLVALMLYGDEWLPSLDQGVVGTLLSKPWMWVLAACLGGSRLSRQWWLHRAAAA